MFYLRGGALRKKCTPEPAATEAAAVAKGQRPTRARIIGQQMQGGGQEGTAAAAVATGGDGSLPTRHGSVRG